MTVFQLLDRDASGAENAQPGEQFGGGGLFVDTLHVANLPEAFLGGLAYCRREVGKVPAACLPWPCATLRHAVHGGGDQFSGQFDAMENTAPQKCIWQTAFLVASDDDKWRTTTPGANRLAMLIKGMGEAVLVQFVQQIIREIARSFVDFINQHHRVVWIVVRLPQ